ncbi:diaminopimelate epimerase-like [Artemia franciscana]|uniref:diaminopimelate epimerase-like n=1 Tax=Artemia franciscana TaxID=6661 RepID=UPI0032DB7741
MCIIFSKMQALGNHFIILEKKNLPLCVNIAGLSTNMCNKHFGAGAEGLLIIDVNEQNYPTMDMYNPDGRKSACGNGLACAAYYIYHCKLIQNKEFDIESENGLSHVSIETESDNTIISVDINLGHPHFEKEKIPYIPSNPNKPPPYLYESVEIENISFDFAVTSIGNPHLVVFVSKNQKQPLDILIKKFGESLSKLSCFPEQSNVEMIQVVNNQEINVRVWERGVGVTLACGTGAAAATVVSTLRGYIKDYAQINYSKGYVISKYKMDEGVVMTYAAKNIKIIYKGEYFLN